MNKPHSTELESMQPEQNEPGTGFISECWPKVVVGVLIAMAVLGINATPETGFLVWLPPAALLGWISITFLLRPRQKAAETVSDLAPGYVEPVPLEMPALQEQVAAAEVKAKEVVAAPAAPVEKPAAKIVPLTALAESDVIILWGSESGNAEGLAEMAEARLKNAGLKAQAIDIGQVKQVGQLAACKSILLITSTWGDGEPPSNAIDLWEAFQKEKADLSSVRFSVLALGDTAYPQFCKCGKDFDEYLQAQGAKRIFPRRDCDLDFEKPFDEWLAGAMQALQSQLATV